MRTRRQSKENAADIGILVGLLTPWLITRFAGMPAIVSVYSLALSLAISMTIGIVFGI
jgi:hypothetical protein